MPPALEQLRQRVPIVMTGRGTTTAGGTFWDSLGIRFAPLGMEFEVGYRKLLAIHGDGITERHWSARVLFHVLKNPAAITAFRLLHPDFLPGSWTG